MENILLAFITGLTTGGLSCLAVQGGLLASSLANQIEKDIQPSDKSRLPRNKKPIPVQPNRSGMSTPILLFLGAKILAYTLLGLLLGSIGSMFQLSPAARAVLQFAIGIFMVGSALRMLNVHPIFRVFAIETPAFLRRRIRKTAASNVNYSTPILLGLLTVLIPCGITQAMMAAALSTADPATGAALMFAFTLGTSPVFFAVAYFATRLGEKLEKYFLRFAAVVVLLLGFFAIDTGLNLAGSPVSFTRLVNGFSAATPSTATILQENNPAVIQESTALTIEIKNNGYEPNVLRAPAGVPVKIKLVSKDVFSCSLSIVIPALKYSVNMMPNDEVIIDIPAQAAGTHIPYACSMGMYTGDILFE
jgi:sulfite exporter TauE/SafE